MITHNGTYLSAATHHGMRITAATMGGKWVMAPWHIAPATQQAILAAFGSAEGTEVISKTNDYLNAIAATDPERALQLANFINEDPMLVCSLVETSKTRWLVGDGKAWINADFYATQNTTAKAKAKLLGTSSASSYQGIFGARKSAASLSFDICFLYPNKMFFDFSNKSVDNIPLGDVGTVANVEMSSAGGWLNGDAVFDSSTTAFTTPSKVAIFGRTDGGTTNTRPLNGAIAFVEFGGDVSKHFLPMLRTDGTCGMLDIISCTFHPNANTSGAFTIALTDKTPA